MYKRLQAFKNAFRGWAFFWHDGVHPKIQIVATGLALAGAVVFDFSKVEWALLLLFCALVLVAEVFNSVFEGLMDYISPAKQEAIGKLKDMAAGAVLIAALAALVFALTVFLPKILNWL